LDDFIAQLKDKRKLPLVILEARRIMGIEKQDDVAAIIAKFNKTVALHRANCGPTICKHLLRLYRFLGYKKETRKCMELHCEDLNRHF
jgi:hypothetical protein